MDTLDKPRRDNPVGGNSRTKRTKLATRTGRDPDGLRVAFISTRGGWTSIYQKPANGTGAEEKLFEFKGGLLGLADWSHDGRFLAYYTNAGVNSHSVVLGTVMLCAFSASPVQPR